MKKFLAFLLVLAMTLSLVTVTALAAPSDGGFEIRIVHTNDIHARLQEDSKSGIIGAARLKGMIDAHTAEGDMSLVLDSGDLFHGQSFATLVEGESVARLIAACGYDAMTAGNHDWNYGKDRLKELAGIAGVEMLTGNVTTADGAAFFDNEFYTEEVTVGAETLKVGLFGVIDPVLYSSTAPANVAGLQFTDSVAYSKEAAAHLRADGCDVVIALTHTYDPQALASAVDGVDLWLAGHEHVDIDTTVTTPSGATAYVMEDGKYLGSVGLVTMSGRFDENGAVTDLTCTRESVDYEGAASYPADAAVDKLLGEIMAEEEEKLNQVVGTNATELDGDWYNVRLGETNLGRVVADAYLMETGADIAFENAGGIRASVEPGDVTYGDIIGVSPFGNYIVTKEITGNDLLEILETVLDIQVRAIASYEAQDEDTWPENSGSYLQFGGLTVTYNPDLPTGSRVLKVQVGDAPLTREGVYTVATNNFVAVSEDFPALAQAEEVGQFSACDEALIRYFATGDGTIENTLAQTCMVKSDSTVSELPEVNAQADSAEQPADETQPEADATDAETDNDDLDPRWSLPFILLFLMCLAFVVWKMRIRADRENHRGE